MSTDPRSRHSDLPDDQQATRLSTEALDPLQPPPSRYFFSNLLERASHLLLSDPLGVIPMTLPNFVVVGVAKAGTSSLHGYLRQHPDVFMPQMKDPGFFAFNNRADPWRYKVTSREAYEALFADVRGERAIGEVSDTYFDSKVAPASIKAAIPDAQLIVSLREPASRASALPHDAAQPGRERGTSFLEALKQSEGLRLGYHDSSRPISTISTAAGFGSSCSTTSPGIPSPPSSRSSASSGSIRASHPSSRCSTRAGCRSRSGCTGLCRTPGWRLGPRHPARNHGSMPPRTCAAATSTRARCG